MMVKAGLVPPHPFGETGSVVLEPDLGARHQRPDRRHGRQAPLEASGLYIVQ
jgi:hypothetical protein